MTYPFSVYRTQVEDHVFWVAESTCLKGCVGQGDTLDEAYSELEENEKEWLETAKEYDIEIPAVPIAQMQTYSGKFMVRVSTATHKEAAEQAKKQGISLNQYVNDAIVAQNNRVGMADWVSTEAKRVKHELQELFSTFPSSVSYGNTDHFQIDAASILKGPSYPIALKGLN